MSIGLPLAGCGGGRASGTADHAAQTTVPLRAQQRDLVGAYELLHRLGFRVALSRATPLASLDATLVKLSPRPWTRLARGSVVTITPIGRMFGSPAVLTSNPHYLVPDFKGRLLSVAVAWAEAHAMYWAVPELPPLPASSAARLFDAYRIVAQQPQPGSMIGQGVMVGRGFKPTPLTLTVVPR